ncbi:MAG TPA: secondary thiamine-phosphate synthase enzyme YjbQ [Longimicrobiales bacterium]|nr:secondary thiamine-phosphate synthase enzyme YjbQ [Longimicrobiales bacterium]
MAGRIRVQTNDREELLDITPQVRALLRESGVRDGVMYLWSLHTTCALTVNEGADPDVARDMVVKLGSLVPRQDDYLHAEGNSDAHVKTSLFGPGLTLLVENGDLLLGTWQKVFLGEWDGPRTRQIGVQILEG